ncbi:hypothetical protein GCM10025867_12520 [Frondihabitans sucicola]|uniref:Uncharacterized protein n=1 Tax=Frondihabitans sucicola TaxID=1268041 RepID=A0ABM8GKS9_9MICO|nr:hypothetical protein GCM10025867_12520 [Frondihabitans sucicola]
MPPALRSFFTGLGDRVRSFSLAQKTLALLAVAVLILGSVALTSWLTKPAYTPCSPDSRPRTPRASSASCRPTTCRTS